MKREAVEEAEEEPEEEPEEEWLICKLCIVAHHRPTTNICKACFDIHCTPSDLV